MTNTRKPPMTCAEARENVALMKRHTKKDAQIKLFEMALGRYGNLTDDARAIYAARLSDLKSAE